MLQYCENISLCRYKIMFNFYDQQHINPDNLVIVENNNWTCGTCDVCTNRNFVSFISVNTTAEKLMTCFRECNLNNKFLNYKTCIPFLKGKCTVDILLNNLHESQHFGKLCSWSDGQIKRLLIILLSQEVITMKLIHNGENQHNIPITYNTTLLLHSY